MRTVEMRRPAVAVLVPGLIAVLAVVSVLALALGAASIPWRDTVWFLWAELTGATVVAGDIADYRIVVDSRLPRGVSTPSRAAFVDESLIGRSGSVHCLTISRNPRCEVEVSTA